MHRYLSLNEEVKRVFGQRIDRVTVNAHMTCPNIDGLKAKGGCTFCQDASYEGLTLLKERVGIHDQIKNGMQYVKERYPSTKFFAYYQNGTNTYESPEKLRNIFQAALDFEEVVGIFIATRPDCISKEVADVLHEINQKTYLWVELGCPSHKDEINRRLNRAHSVEDFVVAADLLAQRGIKNCVHVILGLPGETDEDVIDKARFFSQTRTNGVKIHNLVVFTDTALEKQYKAGIYQPLELEKYVQQCVDYLEYTRPDMVVMRLNAHGPKRITVAPEWSINKWTTINAIHLELEKRNTVQGRYYIPC